MNQTETFLAGRRAALSTLSPSLNPHGAGSPEAKQWGEGYLSGAQQVGDYANRRVTRARWETEGDRYIGGGVWR